MEQDSNVTLIKKCKILGVNVAVINMQMLVDYIIDNIKILYGKYICVSNVHTVVTAYENKEYQNVQNGAVLVIPDGGPLSFVGRRRGYRKMERTTGPDFMGEIFKISNKYGYRHYFYGSTNETLEKLEKEIYNKYGDICIAGMYSPPFRQMTDEEDFVIIEEINKHKPDFVWVGLGAPKQEIWMANHKDKINGLMVGVGAAFDYYAGNIKRAPKWMQKANLEWVYRLFQDPKRLFFRYFNTNFKFIWNAIILGK